MIQRSCAQVDSKPDNALLDKIYLSLVWNILLNILSKGLQLGTSSQTYVLVFLILFKHKKHSQT